MVELEDTATERLMDSVSSAYPVDDPDSDWNALFTAIGNQFEELDEVRNQVHKTKSVTDADGVQLEKLASVFDLHKLSDESDAEFRSRVQTALRKQFTSATRQETEDIVSVLFNIDTSEITIREWVQDQPAYFEVTVSADAVGQLEMRPSALNTVLEDVSAVGVNGAAIFFTGETTLRIIGGDVVEDPMFVTEDNDIYLDYGTVVVADENLSPDASMRWVGEPVQNQNLNSDGLSSATLDPLSSGGWNL